MIKQRRLGQHFLTSHSIAESIVSEAEITKNDTVLEIGTGDGILVTLLCEKAGKVISVDVDESLVSNARSRFSGIDNLVLKSGDGFKIKDAFDIFVSSIPYSKSRDAIEWLAQARFSHGVIMVQKEFAEKLLTQDSKQRRSVSIIATHALKISAISGVGRNNFNPPPKIDSVILKIAKKNDMTRDLIQTVNKIFSYRRKTVKNVLKQFNMESATDKRMEQLSGDEIIDLAKKIIDK